MKARQNSEERTDRDNDREEMYEHPVQIPTKRRTNKIFTDMENQKLII